MADHSTSDKERPSQNPAVNVIRAKIDSLYASEPAAKEEISDALKPGSHSKHQRFMQDLVKSGKSLAEIQTEWHNYYVNLPDDEKHTVWQEFYKQHGKGLQPTQTARDLTQSISPTTNTSALGHRKSKPKTVAQLKRQVLGDAPGRKLSKKQHLKSLLFGLSIGAVTLVVVLISFFNERFIAPFISPSRSVSSTPIIIEPNSTVVGDEDEIVIPKINVEIPVVYDVGSIDEKSIQKGLEDGVVHYATTPQPGELGNIAIVGHSSNNIFNRGKYKFAFVLLKQLEVGDTFMLTKDGTRFVYKVFEKKIVKPTDVSVLGPSTKPATATLITCDPPGTAINRLVIVGEQITPDPIKNTKSKVQTAQEQPQIVPGNAPSLWSRFWSWLATLPNS